MAAYILKIHFKKVTRRLGKITDKVWQINLIKNLSKLAKKKKKELRS